MIHSKKIIRIIIDILAINIAFIIVQYLLKPTINHLDNEILLLGVYINLMWFATLSVNNSLYGRFEYTRFRVELKSVYKNLILHFLGFSVSYLFLFNGSAYYLLVFYTLLIVCIFSSRFFFHLFLPRLRRIETLKYITIGYSDALSSVERTISDAHFGKVKCLGSFGENIPEGYINLGSKDSIYSFLTSNKVHLILYASNDMNPDDVRKLVNYSKLNFIDFKIIPLELELLSSGIKMEIHGGFPILSVQDENIARIRNRLIKRVFDILFSLAVIILIYPWLCLILALLIKIESTGPVLFIQDRVGYKNKTFRCYKFRSMFINSEAKDGKYQQASKGDSRITKIGHFMRRTNLDEFPQFINVFIGNMSVVGPRPHPVKLDINLKNEIEEYILRHYIKPGLTGWAQVNGWRGPTVTKEQKEGRSNHDIWYLQNWSLFLDIKIIFLTVFSAKSRNNAF